jgi:hypothetical protein
MSIILVPIIMYYLFLEDALYFKLNAQEPVVAAPFDMLTVNYNMPVKDVGHFNRLIYCDHSSAYDSSGAGGSRLDATFDCQGSPPGPEDESNSLPEDNPVSVYAGSDKGHHTEHGAHQCWVTQGAQQLQCFTGGDAPKVGTSILASGPASKWIEYYNKGALTTCSDRVGVMNYIIMTKFFSWSAKGPALTGGPWGDHELRHNTKWAHADAAHANDTNQILMPEQKLAILTDPWALNHLAEVTPNENAPVTSTYKPGEDAEGQQEKTAGKGQLNRLSNRTGTYYLYYGNNSKAGGQAAFTSVNDFFSSAKDDFLVDNARLDGLGDEPESVPVLYTNEKTRAGTAGYASGWADSRQASINRGTTYPTNW